MKSSCIKTCIGLFFFLFGLIIFYPQNAFAFHGGVFGNNYACHIVNVPISGCKQESCTSNPYAGSAYISTVSYSNTTSSDGKCNTAAPGTVTHIEPFTDDSCEKAYVGFCPERCKTNSFCGVGGICAATDYKDSPAYPETVEGICGRSGEAPYERKWCLEAVCGYKCSISNNYTCEEQGPGSGIGPDNQTCENGRTQPYLQACAPSDCPIPSKDGKSYQCSTVSGAGSGPAGWTYEAGYTCGYGSGKGCFSKPILPSTCVGEIAGLKYECKSSCPLGWNSTIHTQLYTCSDPNLPSCCVQQPPNVVPNCIVGECDSCGGQAGSQTVVCDGGGGGVNSCVSDVACPIGAPPPEPPGDPPPSGTCDMSLVSKTTSSATVKVVRTGGGARNYNRVNWYKDGVFVGAEVVGGASSDNFTISEHTLSPYTSGTHSASILFWSEGGPGGNPNPTCQLNFTIDTSLTPVGALTCCHIPGNIGRWSTDVTCPGGSAVSANFNTNTSSSGYRKGEGCYREGEKPYEADEHQIGGNAWVVDVAGNMVRPNFGHYFYWISNPNDSSTNTPNYNTPYCILNTSFNGKSACISAYTPEGTWGYTAYGGDGWGQYQTNGDGGLLYRHRKSAEQGAGDSGVDKRFILLDYDHSVDPIGFLTYTEVHGTQNCGDDGCQYHTCERLSQIYNWPTNQAKFYFWNSNLSSAEGGTAVVNDSSDGSSHTGTLTLNPNFVSGGGSIENINPATGTPVGYANFCTSSLQTGEMGYVLGNARIDPVFRKNLAPPDEFELTVAPACSGEATPYVQLSWTPSFGASGSYLIYRQADGEPTPTSPIAVVDISQTDYADLGAGLLNTNYHYFIQAQNSDGCTRNDTPAGSCSGGGSSVVWKSTNSGYCDSQPPILDDIVNLPTLPFCTVPDDRAASGARANRLWSNYQPVEVLAHDRDPNPSGIERVVLTLKRDDSGAVLYSGSQSVKAASGYYEFSIPSQTLNSVLLNTNEYTLTAQAFDYSANPSNVVSRYFQADSSCRCASIGAVGDVHGNTGIYISCDD